MPTLLPLWLMHLPHARSLAENLSYAIKKPRSSRHSSSISVLAVVSVGATIVCVLAAIQQLTSWISRRQLQESQDELLREYRLTGEAKAKQKDLEQYSKRLDELQDQINTQLPVQARRDYLKERLDRLERDLYRDFTEYQQIEMELARSAPQTTLDAQIRRVIETAIVPNRSLQDRRNLGTLLLVLSLLVIDISPLSLNGLVYDYFNVLGYSEYSSYGQIMFDLGLGAIVFLVAFILVAPLLSRGSRTWRFINWLGSRKLIVASSFALVAVTLIIGFYARTVASNEVFGVSMGNLAIPEIIAGFAFNGFVVSLSLVTGGFWLRRRGGRIQRRRGRGFVSEVA